MGAFDSQLSTCKSGIVRSLKITNDYLILAKVLVNNTEKNVVLDGSSILSTKSHKVKSALLRGIDSGYLVPSEEALRFNGKPTVVGILPDGFTLLIGAEDGTFHEIKFTEDGTRLQLLTRKQVASNSPIRRIYYQNDCYFIFDSEKLFWKSRLATTLVTVDDYINAFKSKNQMTYATDLLESTSPELVKKLGLELKPVRDENLWRYEP